MNRNLATLAAAVAFAAAVNGESASATAEPIAVDSRGSTFMRRAERFESPADSEAHRADFARFKEECAAGAFVIGQASSMENIRPRAGFRWRKADEVKVRLARGECESVQILVAPNERDLKGVKVTVEDDLGAFAATNITASVVGYSITTNSPPYKVRPLKGGGLAQPPCGWWPDPILDFQKSCDVSGTDVQSFWVRMKCPRHQAAGLYEGALVVSAEMVKSIRIPFSVRVNDFEVGRTSPLPLAITVAPGSNKTNDWRNDWKKHPEATYDFFADYFLSMDALYWRQPNWDALVHLRDQGRLGMFNLYYIWKGIDKKGLDAIRRHYDKARELGIENHAYIYGFDEMKQDAFPTIAATVGTLRREFPGVPVMTTARDRLFGADGSPLAAIDIFCPGTCSWNPAQVERTRREGRKVFWYFANIPASPFANTMLECPPCEIRSLMGAQTQKFKPDGFLYYATTKWNSSEPIKEGPFTTWEARSYGPYHGDGQWTCCGGPDNMPLATIRLENFRDGLEDLWYARTLEELYARRMAEKIREDELVLSQGGETAPDDWCERARKVLAVPDEVARSTATFSVDPDVIYRWRDEMADLIDEASRK